MGNFNQSERRAHKRFSVKEGAFAVIKEQHNTKTTIGQVVDISEDGLAFKYMAGSEPVKAVHKLDIFFQVREFSLRVYHSKLYPILVLKILLRSAPFS